MFGGLGAMFSHQQGHCCQCHSQQLPLGPTQPLYPLPTLLPSEQALSWASTYDPNLTREQRDLYQRNGWKRGYKP